jgi:hypothetical protein
VHVTSLRAYVDGEDDIKEQDVLTVEAYVAVTRASHQGLSAPPPALGKAPVRAHAPRFPHPVKEKWYAALHWL